MSQQILVAGVDGCRSGWVCFIVDVESRIASYQIFRTFVDVAEQLPSPSVIAVDIQIGLVEKGSRSCDQAARKLLGKPRGSSVFAPPVRPALHARNFQEACRLSRQANGKALSLQANAIRPKIREVDKFVKPRHQKWVVEVHPEVSFWALNGQRAMKYKKSSKEGRLERLILLQPSYPDLERYLANKEKGMAADDLIDAAVAAWTAERIANGSARPISPEEFDSKGLRMEIVY